MNLSTGEICRVLKKHYRTKSVFLDCVPCDMIPSSDKYPYAVVVNTDKTGKPGRHWVAVYVRDPGCVEYFDSSGSVPQGRIKRYLDRFPDVTSNDAVLQSPLTDVCGAYCIYFIVKRCSGKTFKEIVQFLRTTPEADLHVCSFYYKLL